MKVYSLITATQERQQGTTTRILLLNAVRILLNTHTSGALEFFSKGGFFKGGGAFSCTLLYVSNCLRRLHFTATRQPCGSRFEFSKSSLYHPQQFYFPFKSQKKKIFYNCFFLLFYNYASLQIPLSVRPRRFYSIFTNGVSLNTIVLYNCYFLC